MKAIVCATLAWLPAAAVAAQSGRDIGANDYPTAARADYVFACMNVNGGSQEALNQCSCSLDVIASILPYARYEAAETIMRMRHDTGYLGSMFRVGQAKQELHELQNAQAEAEVRCF